MVIYEKFTYIKHVYFLFFVLPFESSSLCNITQLYQVYDYCENMNKKIQQYLKNPYENTTAWVL